MNGEEFIGPFPEPLAITLGANVVLTLGVAVLYVLSFRPFIARLACRTGRPGERDLGGKA